MSKKDEPKRGRQRFHQGQFKPRNPEKYRGDVHNIWYRSSWELKFLNLCDLKESIVAYSSEEIVIPYISPKDGRRHRYFPDFLIEVKVKGGGTEKHLIEIKPYAQTIPPVKKSKKTKRYINEVLTYAINQYKWAAAEAYCQQRGWKFITLTEKELKV